jgi:WD40 repeat protein
MMGAQESAGVWNVRTRDEVWSLQAGYQSRHAVAFSPDGCLLALRGEDSGPVELWDVATREKIGDAVMGEAWSLDPASFVTFLADGKTLVSARKDGKIAFWDVAALRKARKPAPRR